MKPPQSTPTILFLIDSLWVGGSERSLAEMQPHLRSAGIHTTIACLRRRDEGVEREVLAEGIELRYLNAGALSAQVWAVRRLLKKLRPQILHTALFRSNLVGRLAAVGLSVKVLSSLVNTPYEPVRFQDPSLKAKKFRIAQFVDALTARLFTDHFHAVSHAAKAAAIRDLRVPAERITVVERGGTHDGSANRLPSAAKRVVTD